MMDPDSRDPAWMDQVLSAVRKAWLEHSSLRLCQLLVNAIQPSEPCPELYSTEDSVLVRKLDNLAAQRRR
jgi:hypothetical protein